MKITKRQLRMIIREGIIAETRPTFGLRPGDSVQHRSDPWRGVGRVVSKSHPRDRSVGVMWPTNVHPQHVAAGYRQSRGQSNHDPSELMKVR